MKFLLLTNILTPFRVHFYDLIYQNCQEQNVSFNVLVMSANEPGRVWDYDKLKRSYTTLLKGVLLRKFGIDWIFNIDTVKQIREYEPDVIVCAGSYMNPSVWQALRLSRKRKYKIFFWSESHLNEKRNYSAYKLKFREEMRRLILNRFDGFWVAGKMSHKFVEKYIFGEKKYVFVPNLVDEVQYVKATHFDATKICEIRGKLGIQAEKKILLCPARLSHEKGHLEFLALLAKVSQKDNLVLLLPGEGTLKDKIKAEAKKLNMDVRLLGFQNQDEMIQLYAISDIFVLPSLSDPNPLTCIEASWAGKTLLVSDHVGNHPELVQEGKNGYVFSYDAPDLAVEKMEKLFGQSAEQLRSMGCISLENARRNYDSQKVVKRVLEETLTI